MKQATQKIIQEFPYLEKKIKEVIEKPFPEELLQTIDNEVDRTFVTLAYFFENPNSHMFSLSLLYQHLENSWLEFALELISFYFVTDTYLIQNPSHSLLANKKEQEKYYNQTNFARYLSEKGLGDYTQNKIAVYIKRGKIPKEDLLIDGTKYWSESTVESFAQNLEKEKDINTEDNNQ